jgi:hypothetical protein
MSDFLLNKDSIIIDLSADSSIDVSGHALVFNRGAHSPQCSPLLALRSKRLNIAVGDMSER